MAELILHHYEISPYAEKVRLLFGLKGLSWRSVIIPDIMPKPDLLPLTGGYRRTPVLQIGADIYCDTERIAVELERRYPSPTLYPAGSAGLAAIVGTWVATNLFMPSVRYPFGINADKMSPAFFKDRAAMRGVEVNVPAIKAAAGKMHNRLRAQLEWVESLLSDGRPYLLGDQAGLADCSVFHCFWYVRREGPPVSEALTPYPNLLGWMSRMDRIGHGTRTEMAAAAALDVARQSQSEEQPAADAADAEGFKPGECVSVTTEDTGRDPVVGELVSISSNTLALRRWDDRVGEVTVHFPRVGYDLQRV